MRFAIIAAAALISFFAASPLLGAADDGDWPYEGLNAVGYDSADVF